MFQDQNVKNNLDKIKDRELKDYLTNAFFKLEEKFTKEMEATNKKIATLEKKIADLEKKIK